MEMAHMGYGFGLGFLNFIGTILFFVLLFGVLRMFMFGRSWQGGHMGRRHWKRMKYAGGPWARGDARDDGALETARERYAKGEISKEQYEAIKSGLEAQEAKESHDDGRGWQGWWNRDNALETARVRFAKGEISLEEYQAIKKGLES